MKMGGETAQCDQPDRRGQYNRSILTPLDELCTNSVGSRHSPAVIIRDFLVEITFLDTCSQLWMHEN